MVKTLRNVEIEIDKNEVCRYLGYRKDQAPRPSISSLIDEEMDNVYELIQPSCFYQLIDIEQVHQSRVILKGGLTITSEVLGQVLSHCHQVAIFLATIGRGPDNRVAQLMAEGQILRATVLDAVGSETVEKTTDYLQERVSELAAADDAEITLRYSPGYCDWDITQQRVIFEAMNSAPLSVSLTEECLMVPRKSVSGLIGIGKFDNGWARSSPCRFCSRANCPSRR